MMISDGGKYQIHQNDGTEDGKTTEQNTLASLSLSPLCKTIWRQIKIIIIIICSELCASDEIEI